MKKFQVLLTIVLFLGLALNAQAYNMLMVEGGTNVVNNRYIIVDNSGSAPTDYSDSYYGYQGSGKENGYSGYYLGTVLNENTRSGAMADLINHYLGYDYDFNEVKVGVDVDVDVGNTTSLLHVDKSDTTWGSWYIKNSEYALGFYAVSGGDDFALYFVDPSESFGYWNASHMRYIDGIQLNVTHFSAAAPVPEPATMLLLGTGLIGLAGAVRKKLKK